MKKIISFGLLILMLVSVIISCSDKPVEQQNVTETTTSAADDLGETEETEERIDPNLPEDLFYDGYEFRVLTKGTTSSHWYSRDIAAEEIVGEPINDAVYERNLVISEKYGVTIVDVAGTSSDPGTLSNEAKKVISAGDDVYDMLCFRPRDLIADGYLINLYNIPYINLSQPYYDQNIIEAYTIDNRLYCVTGDMLVMDNDAIINVQFNKQIVENFGFEQTYGKSMYQMVYDNEWTLDRFYETGTIVAEDLDGDGMMKELSDRWGYQTETHNYYAFLVGCGEVIAKVVDDYPVITLESERVVSCLEKIVKIQTDKNVGLDETMPQGYSDVWSQVMDKNFESGLVLYNVAGLNRVTLFRAMEIDFGLLPLPKFDELQEEYSSSINTWCGNFIAVPVTARNLERTGLIIEALSCESRYTVLPAYYDITLKTKLTRDNESSEILDILLNTTRFDIGIFYNWGNMEGLITGTRDAGQFISKLSANMKATNKAIEKTMDAFLDFE